jgi:6,7-dimethyl-8-ribityllumazine synthase
MQESDKGTVPKLEGEGLRIGIVRARFNDRITKGLEAACRDELLSMGVVSKHISTVTVPGALEIPLALQALADNEEHDALIALGCIVRGETYHFELVANESGAGITRVGLDHKLPIANAVLTVENMAQAEARVDEKGRDAARVAVELANLMEDLT